MSIVVMVLGMLFTTVYFSGTDNITQSEATTGNILVNGLLTISLILTYLKMAQTQQKEAKLAELERKPLLEVPDFSINGESIELEVSNYGGGLATDMRLATVVEFEGRGKIQPGIASVPLRRASNSSRPKNSRSIRPHDEGLRFKATPYMSVHSDNSASGFPLGTSTLVDAEIESFAFQFYVRYTTVTGERYSVPVFSKPRDVNANEPLTLEEAYSVGDLFIRQYTESLQDPEVPLPKYRSK